MRDGDNGLQYTTLGDSNFNNFCLVLTLNE